MQQHASSTFQVSCFRANDKCKVIPPYGLEASYNLASLSASLRLVFVSVLSVAPLQQQVLNPNDRLGVAKSPLSYVFLELGASQPNDFQFFIGVARGLHRCQVFGQIDVQLLVAKTRRGIALGNLRKAPGLVSYFFG